MTTIEMMAVETLRGDMAAAWALADALVNEVQVGNHPVMPKKQLAFDAENVRVIFFYPSNFTVQRIDQEAVRRWIRGDDVALPCTGATHVDLYSLPGAK